MGVTSITVNGSEMMERISAQNHPHQKEIPKEIPEEQLTQALEKSDELLQEPVSEEEPQKLEAMFDALRHFAEEFDSFNVAVNVSFTFKDDYNDPVIEVIDQTNNKVIRQIPSEEFIERVKDIEQSQNFDDLRGLIFDATI